MRYESQRYLAERPDGHTLDGTPGDCYRTALAAVVSLARDEVPHFAQYHRFDDAVRRWVRDTFEGYDLGWYLPTPWPLVESPSPIQQLAIATGPSPRGDWMHCVVIDAVTGDLVHDPHPSGEGLAGDITCIDLLVPTYDPAPEAAIALGGAA